jgi:hypothetical protein
MLLDDVTRRRTAMCALVIGATLLLQACGPELTTPASRDATGYWASAEVLSGVDTVTMQVTQAASGQVAGAWAGAVVDTVAFPCEGLCPEQGGAISGPIVGAHTVFQLHLSLGGIGEFYGQMISRDSLRGFYVGGHSSDEKRAGFVRISPP